MITADDGTVLFSRAEMSCPCCQQARLMEPFLVELKRFRMAFQRPMTINSAARCPAYNRQCGGHPRSLHMFTEDRGACAVDVHCPDGHYRHRLIHMALDYGFSVGVYQTFCHLDLRTMVGLKPQVFWGGY